MRDELSVLSLDAVQNKFTFLQRQTRWYGSWIRRAILLGHCPRPPRCTSRDRGNAVLGLGVGIWTTRSDDCRCSRSRNCRLARYQKSPLNLLEHLSITYSTAPSLKLLVRKHHLCRQKKGIVTSSPLASGLAIAIGTLIGLVVLGNSSVKVGLLGAISAFVVMVVLKSYSG